jgi:hypothetical protein
VEGSDLLVSIFPGDGEVRVSSAKLVFAIGNDGPPRDSGHTQVIRRTSSNPVGPGFARRSDYHVRSDCKIHLAEGWLCPRRDQLLLAVARDQQLLAVARDQQLLAVARDQQLLAVARDQQLLAVAVEQVAKAVDTPSR